MQDLVLEIYILNIDLSRSVLVKNKYKTTCLLLVCSFANQIHGERFSKAPTVLSLNFIITYQYTSTVFVLDI